MAKNIEISSMSIFLFGDKDTNNKVKLTFFIEKKDYLDLNVQFILNLV